MKKFKKIILLSLLFLLTVNIRAGSTITLSVYGISDISIEGRTLEGEYYQRTEKGNHLTEIKDIPAGEYSIIIEHIDFHPVIYNIKLYENDKLDLGVIEPKPRSGVIAGRITYEGKPLKDVEIRVNGRDKPIRTDEKGYFRISDLQHTYDKEPYELIIVKEGYEPLTLLKDVDINRLTLADTELSPAVYVITGQAIPGSEIRINNNTYTADENGNFEIREVIMKDSVIRVVKGGYRELEIDLADKKQGRIIDLGRLRQELLRYRTDTFIEDSWYGAYFFKENFDNYYPFLNIRLNNSDQERAEELLKRILANYIIVQDYSIIKAIQAENIMTTNGLREYILHSADKELLLKELLIISRLNEETAKLHNQLNELQEEYLYRFYHIKLIKDRMEKPPLEEEQATAYLYRDYISMYTNKFREIDIELKDSKKTTETINNMIPMSYDNLLKYEGSPLISKYEIYTDNTDKYIEIKKVEPAVIHITDREIQTIVNFFSIFNRDMVEGILEELGMTEKEIQLESWYKWKELNNE